MKTPWSYISRLTLGRRHPKASQGQSEIARPEMIAKEAAQSEPEAQLEGEIVGPQLPDEISDNRHHAEAEGQNDRKDRIEAVAVEEAGASESDTVPDVNSSASHTHAATAFKRRRNAAESPPAKPSAKTVLPRDSKIGAHVSPEQSLLAEQLKLDDDINHLRLQLGVRLKQQNAQLRKMLERFNAN
ncbi:hypothetical protein ACCS67_30695 [Rhizobium brockwellii]|jgi:hypothetical protein|uniref:hypothetical protein n=1 Tax=Rhizobium brockwellii TaxID=3019932 RepID=UPI003F9B2A39